MPVIALPGFQGGVVLNKGADAGRASELLDAVGVDIGPRGDLRPASTVTPWFTLAGDFLATWTEVYGLYASQWAQGPVAIAIGHAKYYISLPFPPIDSFVAGLFTPAAGSTDPGALGFPLAGGFAVSPTYNAAGALVTFASFPFVKDGVQLRPTFVNVGPRGTATPRQTAGLYVLTFDESNDYECNPIQWYDALGTGPDGEVEDGTKSTQLSFRAICAYNNHLFGIGFDNSDETHGDGPSRLMFSNLGNPFKWGNDNLGALGTDRLFSDTDAITVGAAGEIGRALYRSAGALWIGTNTGLHVLRGYGRDSFTTNGTTQIADALDTVGPHAMIEGPDGFLYGVSTKGLWRYIGGRVEHLYRLLVDQQRRSLGWWDLLWTDPDADEGYPGTTNQDLVWMYVDPDTKQVCTVIPYCNATLGAGAGPDTVAIKFHQETGGFTRNIFYNRIYTAGTVVRRDGQVPQAIIMGESGNAENSISRYAYRANPFDTPDASDAVVVFGEYAPFGPNGVGVLRVCYMTLAWQDLTVSDVTVSVTPIIDGKTLSTLTVVVSDTAPTLPADGAYWLDTSGTDTNLGTGTSGTLIPASHAFVLKQWRASWNKWVIDPRAEGANKELVTVPDPDETTRDESRARVTIPIPFTPTRGSRAKFRATWTGAVRTTVEGFGFAPAPVRSAQ